MLRKMDFPAGDFSRFARSTRRFTRCLCNYFQARTMLRKTKMLCRAFCRYAQKNENAVPSFLPLCSEKRKCFRQISAAMLIKTASAPRRIANPRLCAQKRFRLAKNKERIFDKIIEFHITNRNNNIKHDNGAMLTKTNSAHQASTAGK